MAIALLWTCLLSGGALGVSAVVIGIREYHRQGLRRQGRAVAGITAGAMALPELLFWLAHISGWRL